ncbi:type 1 protein phosphatase-activating protein YPI1 [Sporothrix schenckii 1099-18]|uniref:Type 1 phosphatases regulator n=1 Tax=Sporothrix schenckii 1099-18 TaxID=1397361 RepID=A0A0F2M467_SPOSC|nr:type 1 protein phosphatase-activating protein YPI1 [Sporothrix schenckii 1099-18]KJR83899.1 hypothetical protein SPSK_00322 [Sporothrix schenckii 1099-18]
MTPIAPRQLLSCQPQTGASGSQTITTIRGPPRGPDVSFDTNQQQQQQQQSSPAILRLQGTSSRDSQNVQWAEGVVDNEGMNRKKSKVCCIYHRPRAVDESSDDSSSSSESDSSSSSDDDSDNGLSARSDADQAFRGLAGVAGNNNGLTGHNRHLPDRPDNVQRAYSTSGDEADSRNFRVRRGNGNGGKGKGKRKPSPNAYEKIPPYRKPSTTGV